ncbi:unnamed protein product [Clavelina lepadiformis]|uniref:Uncharacterized protein n=1 Tax=Clavelina lepadiformis TaxID=159417 RepID=A0ABP0F0J8_CLALP
MEVAANSKCKKDVGRKTSSNELPYNTVWTTLIYGLRKLRNATLIYEKEKKFSLVVPSDKLSRMYSPQQVKAFNRIYLDLIRDIVEYLCGMKQPTTCIQIKQGRYVVVKTRFPWKNQLIACRMRMTNINRSTKMILSSGRLIQRRKPDKMMSYFNLRAFRESLKEFT